MGLERHILEEFRHPTEAMQRAWLAEGGAKMHHPNIWLYIRRDGRYFVGVAYSGQAGEPDPGDIYETERFQGNSRGLMRAYKAASQLCEEIYKRKYT